MKTERTRHEETQKGYALIYTTLFVGVSILLVTSIFLATSTSVPLTERNNVYNRAQWAAEAATERTLSYVSSDFMNQQYDATALSTYQALIPTNDWASAYQFSDGNGNVNQTFVWSSNPKVQTNINSAYPGLYGLVYNVRIRSNAKCTTGPYTNVTAAVEQDLQLVDIPVFQFAIFYTYPLEINPGAAMSVLGKVHCNGDIYAAPTTKGSLDFWDAVTAVGKIYTNRSPWDPDYGSSMGTPTYHSTETIGLSPLVMPIGTNNTPLAVASLLDPPPAGESVSSVMGSLRFYNQADLVVLITNNNVQVLFNSIGDGSYWEPVARSNLVYGYTGTNYLTSTNFVFLNTNVTFYDYREATDIVRTTQLDVTNFSQWIATNQWAVSKSNSASMSKRTFNSIYINDTRTFPGSTNLNGVRVVNGRYLPPFGLTVVTPLPLYVKGDYNAPNLQTTNTSNDKPASFICDAITLLSSNWSDSYKTSLSGRKPCDITVNAAFIAGIVPSGYVTNGVNRITNYSGGVVNYPRFLEDWNSSSSTYINGSMVVMFPSRIATNKFQSGSVYYSPPVRNWGFDINFTNSNRLPPLTPSVQKVLRTQWKTVAANAPP